MGATYAIFSWTNPNPFPVAVRATVNYGIYNPKHTHVTYISGGALGPVTIIPAKSTTFVPVADGTGDEAASWLLWGPTSIAGVIEGDDGAVPEEHPGQVYSYWPTLVFPLDQPNYPGVTALHPEE